jgi:hypothetical protein
LSALKEGVEFQANGICVLALGIELALQGNVDLSDESANLFH